MMKIGTCTMHGARGIADIRLTAMTSSDLGTYVEGEFTTDVAGSFAAGEEVTLSGGAEAVIVKLTEEVDVIDVTLGPEAAKLGGHGPGRGVTGRKHAYLELRMLG